MISQDPAGGEKRTKGTTIVLTVGKAPSPTTTTTRTDPETRADVSTHKVEVV